MKIVRLAIVLVFMLFVLPLHAQSLTIDLDEALDLALKNNLSLKTNLIDLNAAQRDKETSWNLFLPTVRASLSNSGSSTVFQDNPLIKAPIDGNSGLGVGFESSLPNPALQQQLRSYDLGIPCRESPMSSTLGDQAQR